MAVIAASAWVNMPFSDSTAAWVQAVGSIGAIIGAVWLQDRQRAQDRSVQFTAHRGMILTLTMDVAAVLDAAGEMTRGAAVPRTSLTFAHRQFLSRMRLLEQVDGSKLPPRVFDSMMQLLGVLHSALHITDELLAKTDRIYNGPVDALEDYGHQAAAIYDAIRRAYGLQPEARA